MTNMQLQYSQLFEQKQHNRAMEEQGLQAMEETARANRASEQLKQAQIDADLQKAAAINAANERIAQIQAETNLQLQKMRNFMSEKQLAQTVRQVDAEIEKSKAQIGNIEADTQFTAARTKDQTQRTQSDLKAKIGKIVGNQIDTTTMYASDWLSDPSNKKLLKQALSQPAYRSVINGWNAYQQKQQQAKRGAGAHRTTTTVANSNNKK